MPHARGPVILTLSATASLTPAYPPPAPCPAGCCAGLQIALKVNRARVVFVHLAQQLLHVLLPRGVERAASWAEAGGARGGEGLPGVLVARWSWPPSGVSDQEWRPSGSKSRRPTAASVACYTQPEPRTAPATHLVQGPSRHAGLRKASPPAPRSSTHAAVPFWARSPARA